MKKMNHIVMQNGMWPIILMTNFCNFLICMSPLNECLTMMCN